MLPIIHIKFQRVWNLNLPLLLLIGLLATLKDNETNSQISLRSEVQVCLVGPRNILLLAKTTIDQVFDSWWMTIGSWEWRVVGKDRGPQPKKHDRWDRHCAMQKKLCWCLSTLWFTSAFGQRHSDVPHRTIVLSCVSTLDHWTYLLNVHLTCANYIGITTCTYLIAANAN